MNGPSEHNLVDLSSLHQQSLDNATKIALVQQSLVTLQNDVSKLANTVTTYIQSDIASKKPNYGLWIAFASLLVLMCSGGWMVLTLKINAEIHPMSEKIVALESTQEVLTREATLNRDKISATMSQNQVSIDDRLNLNKVVDSLKDKISTLATAQAADHADRSAHETEIETQFDADNQLRNIQFADQQRVNHTLWEQHKKTLGTYPDAPFYFPNISLRGGKSATRPQ